ncbi:MAG: GNAT family N-acetyltransferase [Deltaproteobacteria bacterium]|nr:GNAT family N-acetyltransferase [Deltaproteobacteria bacterium]
MLANLGASTSWISRVYEVAPFVNLEGTWDSYLSNYKSSFRKWVKKVERKATEHPDCRIDVIDGTSLTSDSIDRLEELERRARHWSEGTAHFADPRFGKMLKLLALKPDHHIELRMLSSGTKWIAAELMLLDRDRALGLWTAFDSTYDYTGTYVVADAIRSCFARGLRLFDFLQGDEEYKLKWATGSREILQVYVARRKVRALLPFVSLSIRWRAAKSERIRRWRASVTKFLRRFSNGPDQAESMKGVDGSDA